MLGLMMDWPLMISSLIRHADRCHGDTEIVSRTVEGPIHRYTYRDAHTRARRLARALLRLGVAPASASARWPGTAIAISSSTTRMSGMGAIIHTINPRLFHDQLATSSTTRATAWSSSISRSCRWSRSSRRPARVSTVDRDDRRAHIRGARRPSVSSATRSCSPARATTTTGRSSTRTPRRDFATRPARPAIRRACCSATARRCCTRSRLPRGRERLLGAQRRAADRPDVPRQRLGHSVLGAAGRREARVPRRRARRQEPVRAVRERGGRQLGRRADRLARPHRLHAAAQPPVLDAQGRRRSAARRAPRR